MSVLREIDSVRNNAGIWGDRNRTVLRLAGKDAISWFHAQCTNDVAGLASGQGCLNALLDRTGRLEAFFSTHRWEDELWLLIDQELAGAVSERIESHVFLEVVTLDDVGQSGVQVHVEGPRTVPFLARAAALTPVEAQGRFPTAELSFAPLNLLGHDVLAFRSAASGEDGYVLIPAPDEADTFLQALIEAGHEYLVPEVSAAAVETLRIEGGALRWPRDLDSTIIINETPLGQSAVSFTKGCFRGQEVVARLQSRGALRKALVGLVLEDEPEAPLSPGAALSVGGKNAGELRSCVWSPTLERWVAFAYLNREHRKFGQKLRFKIGGAGFFADVRPLPLYTGATRQQLARRRYAAALDAYHADPEDEDEAVVQLLEETLLLDPLFEDAYEALGVALHRRHRLDEAIGYMKQLERLNPQSVMAHTNLSVYYVAQGRIQDAEEEKEKARQLELRHEMSERQADEMAQQERRRVREEAHERLAMFEEVLDIDPEDPVATMGMGSSLLQLDRAEEAIPFFEAAARLQKDYSAAYLSLGRCHEAVGSVEAAIAAYRVGIEAAGRKGDLMPMREMERRLKDLASHAAPADRKAVK